MKRAGSQSFFSAPHPLCEQTQSYRQKPDYRRKNNGGNKMHVNWSPSTQRPDKQRYDNCFQEKIISFVISYWHDVYTDVKKPHTRLYAYRTNILCWPPLSTRWEAYRTNILCWPPLRTRWDAYRTNILCWPPLRTRWDAYSTNILCWPPLRTKKDAYSVIIFSWQTLRTKKDA